MINLDNAATTKVNAEVLDAMIDAYRLGLGNSTGVHRLAREASARVEVARADLASAIEAEAREIVFTSGGTESNNWVLEGLISSKVDSAPFPHVVLSSIEHSSLLEKARSMAKSGRLELSELPVDQNGYVNAQHLESLLRKNTRLVGVMLVNNEIGTVQPVADFAKICRDRGIWLHSDLCQAFLKRPLSVREIGMDSASLSAHKVAGPKGIGALYLRRESRSGLAPLFWGGGQEGGLRSGTLNLEGIVGFAASTKLDWSAARRRWTALRQQLLEGLRNTSPGPIKFQMNGASPIDSPIINLTFQDMSSKEIARSLSLKGVAVSTGSSCQENRLDSTSTREESPVLKNMLGVDRHRQPHGVRISMGLETSAAEIQVLLVALRNIIHGC